MPLPPKHGAFPRPHAKETLHMVLDDQAVQGTADDAVQSQARGDARRICLPPTQAPALS
jgi:hypothetical protein